MPEDRRFSEGDLERDLRDLEGRIEYPPTPDVASAVRLRLDEERDRQTRRSWRPPPFLTLRWTAAAAALALVCVFALSPAVRTTLADFLAPGDQGTSEVGGSAAKPERDGSEAHRLQEAGVSSQNAGASSGATGCPYPAIEVRPARGVEGAEFRLGGKDFSSGCAGTEGHRIRPAREIRVYFLQSGKTWRLETIDADRDLTIETRLAVPPDAEPGPATVRATTGYGKPAEAHFTVLR